MFVNIVCEVKYFEDKEYDIYLLVYLFGMFYVNIVFCFSN